MCLLWLQVGVYLPLYDYLLAQLSGLGWAAPLVTGATARTVAVLLTSPLELLRTRMQVRCCTAVSHAWSDKMASRLVLLPYSRLCMT